MSRSSPRTTAEGLLSLLLLPAASVYGLAGKIRAWLYRRGFYKQQRLPVKVISVGNITCGGTGKTPVTIDIARQLLSKGRKVAILSRGYKRRSKSAYVVVSDGNGNLQDCAVSGDEPYLMARMLPQAVVIVGSSRVQTASLAIGEFGCDTLILDDGFQHLRLGRDQNILLLDYNDDIWNGHVLPAGRLREPLSAMSRADWIVISKIPEQSDEQRLRKFRALIARYAPNAQISYCRMNAAHLLPFEATQNAKWGAGITGIPCEKLRDKRVLVLSAIAKPGAFIDQLKTFGAEIVGDLHFPDHHWYTQADLVELERKFNSTKAEATITTAKDAVKLPDSLAETLKLVVLEQEIEWLGQNPIKPMISQMTGAGRQ